jgi:catechol 2,3-dioxygenase-like lactoylglutathione lyase family enzyme
LTHRSIRQDVEMAARFTELIVDAIDPSALADFWSAVLGWRRTGTYGNEVVELTGESDEGPTLVFVPVRDAKVVKNRLHIDVNPTGCDQAEELARLLALGAREVDIGQGTQRWIVLADPEGNEFCLLATRRD